MINISMWDLVRFVLKYTFLLYIFYNAYLEILRLKIYFENYVKSKQEEYQETEGVANSQISSQSPLIHFNCLIFWQYSFINLNVYLFYSFIMIIILPNVSRLQKNYGQGLGREGRRQLIPIKESTTKGVPLLEKDKETQLHGKDKLNAYK